MRERKTRNFGAIAVVFVLLLSAVLAGCGSEEAAQPQWSWSEDIILRDMLPEPQGEIVDLVSNSEQFLNVTLEGAADEYESYLAECKAFGYRQDSETEDSAYTACNDEGYQVELRYFEDREEFTIILTAPEEMDTLQWPQSEAADRLPLPASTVGRLEHEGEDGFSAYIGKTSRTDYQVYVGACMDAGFTADSIQGKDSYEASDKDGFRLTLRYEGRNVMWLQIEAPEEPEEEEPAEEEPAAEEPAAEEPPAPEKQPEQTQEPAAPAKEEPPAAPSSTGSGQGTATTVTVPTQEETTGNLVWVPTHGGRKYHSHSGCSNMRDPIQVSVETATAKGFQPCGRCY